MTDTKDFFKNKECFISSYGYTHSKKRPIDWYYKGNEFNIIKSGSTIKIPQPDINWGGYESEIMALYEFKNNGFTYVGFTLAADFTYTGMRRNSDSKKNISHIAPTVIGSKIFTKSVPDTIQIHTFIKKNNRQIYQENGFSGQKYIKYPISTFINNLYSIKRIFKNNELICILLGSSTSSAIHGIKLTGQEYIRIESSTLETSVDFYTTNENIL